MSFPIQPPPLDVEYNLSPEDSSFLKRVLGIEDDEELKQHLLKVQAEAYAVYPYGCILNLDFAKLMISKHPAYESVLRLGKERENAIFLDLPCCLGGDSRKAVVDGYPHENVIASDLHDAYWAIGHKLFKTTPDTYPVPFLQGDIFNPNFLKPGVSPLDTFSQITTPLPSLTTLTSLTPLQHHVSVIYTSLFFNLFGQEEQHNLAHLIASLLSPLPGSIIFGSHIGASEAEEDKSGRNRFTIRGTPAFAHSPSSWEELWTGENGPFSPEQVSIQVNATRSTDRNDPAESPNPEMPYIRHNLIWSITRC